MIEAGSSSRIYWDVTCLGIRRPEKVSQDTGFELLHGNFPELKIVFIIRIESLFGNRFYFEQKIIMATAITTGRSIRRQIKRYAYGSQHRYIKCIVFIIWFICDCSKQ